jgi:predicted metal-dependent phosphoesterase TrpH
MADVDLHTHTRFFHSFPGRRTWFDGTGARLLVAVARSRGLDAVAVTNHDYHTRFDFDTGDLTMLPGIEVSSTAGHLLVVGPDPPRWTNPGEMTPGEVVDLAHDRGCAVVLAHPYRNSRIRDLDVAVDAVEVNGKESRPPDAVRDLAAERNLPLVGGSDAHFPGEVGRAYTTVDVDRVTPESVVGAIGNDRTDFRVVDRRRDRYLRRLYGLIHRLRGHTDPADWTDPAGE